MYCYQKILFSGFLCFSISCNVYAAKIIDVNYEPVTSFAQAILNHELNVKEINRSVDFKKTLHVRMQQIYQNYPVFGGELIAHIPNANLSLPLNDILRGKVEGSINGVFYQEVEKDLKETSVKTIKAREQNALSFMLKEHQQKLPPSTKIMPATVNVLVYVDEQQKAHWAYEVQLEVAPTRENDLPSKPVYIIDALSYKIYEQWDDIKTASSMENSNAFGGGFGGNKKMGKLVYDGLRGHLTKLDIKRDDASHLCTLENADVTVKNYNGSKVISYQCKEKDPEHNQVYWNGETDAVNGGYSPSNDALFGGGVIKRMYQDWYKIPVLVTAKGTPMMLNMVVHARMDNAYWDGSKMTFGDGISIFYPLTSLGVAAHEISHGFTQQHSNLMYRKQSGGMNEAFSDMAAQAAEFYAYGKNSWQIGPEIFKAENQALRYMDQPSKDCQGRKPGNRCSIDNASQYTEYLDVHYSSGVYNRVFYLIATSTSWNVRKAFDVMVQANSHYWTSTATFATGACGVIKAAQDHNYNVAALTTAFKTVGIDTSSCVL